MDKIFHILLFLIMFFAIFYFNYVWLKGHGKGHIVIDFDVRYKEYKEYVIAIKKELVKQGREVKYVGNREFLIDGETYILIERNIPMGGVPYHRTILKPKKEGLFTKIKG